MLKHANTTYTRLVGRVVLVLLVSLKYLIVEIMFDAAYRVLLRRQDPTNYLVCNADL